MLVDGWSRLYCSASEQPLRLVVERPLAVGADTRRLSPREAHVVKLSAQGLSSKEISLRLVIADATVRSIANHAARKLMLRSATQFPLLWHLLEQTCVIRAAADRQLLTFESSMRALPRFKTLSAAERALAVRLILGDQNVEIAKRRMVSTQTIANQLNVLFRKLDVSSRGELAASLLATVESN